MENREEGYYWVKGKGSEWTIAEWASFASTCSQTDRVTHHSEWKFLGVGSNDRIHGSGNLADQLNKFITEIGPKIEPPEHEHAWKTINEKLSTCSCGALLVMHGAFTDEELQKMEEQMRVPVRTLREW